MNPIPQSDDAESLALGQSIVSSLLGSRISMIGSNEAGEILMGVTCADGQSKAMIIFVEDGELCISEIEVAP